jgi:hypothetical protein
MTSKEMLKDFFEKPLTPFSQIRIRSLLSKPIIYPTGLAK